jgi:hypothetical protein
MTPAEQEKLFTPEQANNMLPLVRRIVQDIVSAYGRWQDRTRELELIAVSRSDQFDDRRQVVEREVHDIATEIAAFEGELDTLGIHLKDYALGLVDFPGTLNGRKVLLCWRLGEPVVEYWHELDAGYSGRRPIAQNVA